MHAGVPRDGTRVGLSVDCATGCNRGEVATSEGGRATGGREPRWDAQLLRPYLRHNEG